MHANAIMLVTHQAYGYSVVVFKLHLQYTSSYYSLKIPIIKLMVFILKYLFITLLFVFRITPIIFYRFRLIKINFDNK